jgi:lipopolysaccharide export system permease protein
VPTTLSLYIARQFAAWFAALVAVAAVLVLILDSLELVRKAASRPEVGVGTVLQMALLHLPHIIDIVLPFAMLFAAMAALWRLSRYQELAVARAAGLSIWQLLAPGIAVAALLGVLKIVAFNPLAATALSVFEDMEAEYFDKRPNNPVLSGSGLWLKDYSGAFDLVIHADTLQPVGQILQGVTVFQFVERDRFSSRIDAKRAVLQDSAWNFTGVRVVGPDRPMVELETLALSTRLDWGRLEESFASPASMPIWRLPTFITLLEAAGFSAAPHRVYFHTALAAPLALVAMVLIAAGFAIRPPRRGGIFGLMTLAAIAGLGFHLLTQVFFRLGLSGQLPAALAAWAPIGCITMLGVTWLLYTEDG